MKKAERIAALKELARLHPHHTGWLGTLWKNPLNPRSTGLRWTNKDMELFKQFQKDARAGRL